MKKGLHRIRNIEECINEIIISDKNTALTESFIKQLIEIGDLQTIHYCGKTLIDLDYLIEYINISFSSDNKELNRIREELSKTQSLNASKTNDKTQSQKQNPIKINLPPNTEKRGKNSYRIKIPNGYKDGKQIVSAFTVHVPTACKTQSQIEEFLWHEYNQLKKSCKENPIQSPI